MKKLFKQQEEIIRNHKDTKGATQYDLDIAITQHIKNSTASYNNPNGAERPDCKAHECGYHEEKFTSIQGYFCTKCGYIFPF